MSQRLTTKGLPRRYSCKWYALLSTGQLCPLVKIDSLTCQHFRLLSSSPLICPITESKWRDDVGFVVGRKPHQSFAAQHIQRRSWIFPSYEQKNLPSSMSLSFWEVDLVCNTAHRRLPMNSLITSMSLVAFKTKARPPSAKPSLPLRWILNRTKA